MSPRSDNELMLQIQAGDLGAFEQLVTRYQTMVHGLAMSILRRPEDAEEATQDAFLKLFRARASFDAARALEPWLLRIAGNACRDKARRRKVAE
ncbi:MAG: sigma-70 family RNA polymerase sigma factor, partial [Planctomycetota bacterium]